MAAKETYKVTGLFPGGVEGPLPVSLEGSMSYLTKDLEEMDGDGNQHSQHPAKNQTKTIRFFG